MRLSRFTVARGGLLARHLGQLGDALGGLGERTRHAVAQALAGAAADLVGDALQGALAAGGHAFPGRRRGGSGLPVRSSLTGEFDDLDRFDHLERSADRVYRREGWEDEPFDEPEPDRETPAGVGWTDGLAAGLRAAALCLGPRTGRPLLKALAAGVVVTATGVVGGPLAAAVLRLVECLLFLGHLRAVGEAADTMTTL